jgi:hypothetical protein
VRVRRAGRHIAVPLVAFGGTAAIAREIGYATRVSPWAPEEIWLRPIATPIACALVPFATAWLLKLVLLARSADDAARRATQIDQLRAALLVTAIAQVALAFFAGLTALGPALVSSARGPWGWAFGCFSLLIALAASVAARRRAARGSHEPGAKSARRWPGIIAGAAMATLVLGGGLAAWSLTAIEDPTRASASAARWRMRADPWDAGAMLASGYDARRRDRYELAVARAREARRMGIAAELALELEAETLAAQGECERARRTFDRAIAARAQRTFEGVLTAPLTLGGYRIPPALITECGGIEQLPWPSDAATR